MLMRPSGDVTVNCCAATTEHNVNIMLITLFLIVFLLLMTHLLKFGLKVCQHQADIQTGIRRNFIMAYFFQ